MMGTACMQSFENARKLLQTPVDFRLQESLVASVTFCQH